MKKLFFFLCVLLFFLIIGNWAWDKWQKQSILDGARNLEKTVNELHDSTKKIEKHAENLENEIKKLDPDE